MRNKAEKWVFEALMSIRAASSFPIIGIDSDNWSEFINWHLLRWCEQNETTFTRSRSGNSNDGAHVKQKNWAVVRTMVGYHRYDTFAELLLLNKIWALQSMMTNYFTVRGECRKATGLGALVAMPPAEVMARQPDNLRRPGAVRRGADPARATLGETMAKGRDGEFVLVGKCE